MDYFSKFEELKSENLSLDLTRGKPSSDQLDLSNSLMNQIDEASEFEDLDLRNYGEIKGLESCRELGAQILNCDKDLVWAGGNSSLSLMSQFLTFMFVEGNGGGPWSLKERVSVLCPVPGYDRHFKLCETFGINMIPVPLTGEGPDLEEVNRLVETDESIKGIWCVPKYSNPTGEVYSRSTIEGLLDIFASPSSKNIIFWDNAYAVHDLSNQSPLIDIFSLAKDKKCEEGILKGMYKIKEFNKYKKIKIQFLGSGTILREMISGAEILQRDYNIDSEIWSVTSFNELRKNGLEIERYNLLNPDKQQKKSFLEECLGASEGPILAASDYMRLHSDQLRPFIKKSFYSLGTDGFGRSDTRANLRKFFEVDKEHIVAYGLSVLAKEQLLASRYASDAIKKYKIDPEKPMPTKL